MGIFASIGSVPLTPDSLNDVLSGLGPPIAADTIFPADYVIIQTSAGPKTVRFDDLAVAMGATGIGVSPINYPGAALAWDFGRKDKLFSDAALSTLIVADGTNKTIGSIQSLISGGRTLSQGTNNDRWSWNSGNVVNFRPYAVNNDTGDHYDLSSTINLGASSGTSFFTAIWAAYIPTSALQANSTVQILGGTGGSAVSLIYDNLGRPSLRKEDAFGHSTVNPAPLDAWHVVALRYSYATGLSISINNVAQAVTDAVAANTFNGPSGNVGRSDWTGWTTGAGVRIRKIYVNTVLLDNPTTTTLVSAEMRDLGLA